MRFTEAARVGLAVVLAAVCLAFVTFWLRGSMSGRDTYLRKVTFPNAQGMQEGAYVRVRGVDMGSVEKVELTPDGSALLTLRIRKSYQVKPADSIRIAGGLLGFNPPYVEITPNGRMQPAPGGDVLTGDSGANTDRLLAQGERLMDNLTGLSERMMRLTDSLTQVTGDPKLRRNLTHTADNLAKFSDKGLVIADNMQRATARADRLIGGFQSTSAQLDRTLRRVDSLMGNFNGTARQSRALMQETREVVKETRGVVRSSGDLVENTNKVMQNAGGLVTDTRSLLSENREKLSAVFTDLDASLKRLDATLTEAHSFIADPQLRNDLRATAENTRMATENLKKISQDVQGLTGDPKVQEDLRATISGLRETTQEAADAFRRVQQVLGTSGKTAKSVRQRLAETRLEGAVLHGIRSDRTRIDFDATIPWSDRTFYRAGFYDLGEKNRVNVQVGRQFRPGLWGRYGFHASRLGFGLDVGSPRFFPVQLDLYGIREPRLDLRGRIPITSYLNFNLGLEDVTRRPDPVFGVSFYK